MRKFRLIYLVAMFLALSTQLSNAQAQRAAPVVTKDVVIEDVEVVYRSIGKILAERDAIITVDKSSRIRKTSITDGERVKKGEILFYLEDEVERAAVAAAKAQLDVNRKALERLKILVSREAAPSADIPKSEAELVATEVGVRSAQLALQKTFVRAPFSGVLGILKYHTGDYVTPGDELVVIHEMPPVRVMFELPQRDLARLDIGQSLKVKPPFGQHDTHSGVLYTIDPALDETTSSIRLIGTIDKADELRPGMVVEVQVVIETRTGVTMVPETALVPRPDGLILFKVDSGKAKQVKIETGVRRAGLVEIRNGLKAGDKVVVEGQFRLRDGAPVGQAGNS